MAVGDSAQTAIDSHVAIFAETTFGTNPNTAGTNSTFIEFLSNSFKIETESQKLESLGVRGSLKRVQLNKNVTGALETHLHPRDSVLMLANAMGGGINTASLTAGAFTHSISAGVMDTAPTSIAFNVKKGNQNFGYLGGRVNQVTITANVGELVTCNYEFVMKDGTIGATDITSSLSITSVLPFTFVNGVYRYQATEAAADTTTAEEPIQGFELTINNNLKSDADARELGTNLLTVLPPTRKNVEFKINQRFDTTTTFNRFIQATQGSVELKFTGASITAEANYDCEIRLPKVFANTPDPEIPGPADIIKSEITYDVVVDTGTASGREIGLTVINDVSAY